MLLYFESYRCVGLSRWIYEYFKRIVIFGIVCTYRYGSTKSSWLRPYVLNEDVTKFANKPSSRASHIISIFYISQLKNV